jgi:hypothetical protein
MDHDCFNMVVRMVAYNIARLLVDICSVKSFSKLFAHFALIAVFVSGSIALSSR